ncbi:hypothetical protein JTB14_001825 [Gonioctena quinquepunctata]|nr:hypothetical protein JTB14_001825 [Gonioctena quinquepunctata]
MEMDNKYTDLLNKYEEQVKKNQTIGKEQNKNNKMSKYGVFNESLGKKTGPNFFHKLPIDS